MSHATYYKEQGKFKILDSKTTKQQKKKGKEKKKSPQENKIHSNPAGMVQESVKSRIQTVKKNICLLLVVHLQLKIDFIPARSGLGSLSTSSVILFMSGNKKTLTHQFKSTEWYSLVCRM